MSCTVQVKSRNSVTQKKVSNVIHRTTSETIRLGEPETIINNSSRQVMTALAISPPPLKQSTCSFQITGVSLTQRTDFVGDDSADDLDESHTDDISRVTDNETPSFSEDTCSRDADESYVGSCSAVCSVTAVSTYSQYGLAIVPSETLAVNCLVYRNNNSSSSAVSNVATPPTLSSKEEDLDMSCSKSPEANVMPSTSTISVTIVTTSTVTTNTRFPGTRFHVVNVETPEPFRRGRWWCTDYLDDSIYTPKNALTYKSPDSPEVSGTQPQPQYTMTATTKQTDGTKGILDVGTKFNVYPFPTQSSTMSERSLQNIIAHSQPYSMSVVTQQQNVINAAQTFIRQNSMPETKTQMQMQNYIQNQYIQALPIGITGVQVNNTTTTNSNDIVSSLAYQPLPIQQQTFGSVLKNQSSSVGRTSTNSAFIPTQTSIVNASLVQPAFNQYSGKSMTNIIQQTSSLLQANSATLLEQNMLSTSNCQTTQTPVISYDNSLGPSIKRKDYDDLHCCTKISGTRKTYLEPVAEDGFVDKSRKSTPAWTPAEEVAVAAAATLLFPASKDITTEPKYKPYAEAANKHSSVIDNKIEKAMDLVKSHLMYTVREEVEVLKLRIAELLDRINQLEMENSFLRANASMDVLNALNNRSFQQAEDGKTSSIEVEDDRVIPTQ